MPAMVWCTNFSDTMPNAQSCCISSTGVDRPGSLHKSKKNALRNDSDMLPTVLDLSKAPRLSTDDITGVILQQDKGMDDRNVLSKILA